MKHYYTDNQDLPSEQSTFTFTYKGVDIQFVSDIGVFSKTMIDYGSRVMLDTISFDDNSTLLDVGCGYGTFGVCLKKLHPAITVDMIDVNSRALDLCRHNAVVNDVEVNVYKSDMYGDVKKQFDTIVTNPPIRAGKAVVMEIITKSYEHLNDGGRVWVVIQKKQGAPSVKKRLEEIFGNCEVAKKDKGYYILVAKK